MQMNVASRPVGMEGKKGTVFSGIATCSTGVPSLPLSGTMTKSINIINTPTESSQALVSNSSSSGSSLGVLTASPPITINITHVSSLPPPSATTAPLIVPTVSSPSAPSTDVASKPSILAVPSYHGTSVVSNPTTPATMATRPTSISISNIAPVSVSSISPISSVATTIAGGYSTQPPLLSHVHIPRGAAVVANMAGTRTSLAVTASAAQ